MPIQHGIKGVDDGHFRQYPPDNELGLGWDQDAPLYAAQKTLGSMPGLERIMRLSPCMGTTIMNADNANLWNRTAASMVRSPICPCDGVVTANPNVALALANGDCPAAIVWNMSGGDPFIALLHCGLGALVPKNGEPGILEKFFLGYLNRNRMYVALGYGIGPCCYALNRLPELTANAHIDAWPVRGMTVRDGQPAYRLDLIALMRAQCRYMGLRDEQILAGNLTLPCTACKKTDTGRHMYRSNLREGPNADRNLVYALMD